MNQIKEFTAIAGLWVDQQNGNTYHAVLIVRHTDGETLACPLEYGYGEAYQQTAFDAMYKNGWLTDKLPQGPCGPDYKRWEIDNCRPIIWVVKKLRKSKRRLWAKEKWKFSRFKFTFKEIYYALL